MLYERLLNMRCIRDNYFTAARRELPRARPPAPRRGRRGGGVGSSALRVHFLAFSVYACLVSYRIRILNIVLKSK